MYLKKVVRSWVFHCQAIIRRFRCRTGISGLHESIIELMNNSMFVPAWTVLISSVCKLLKGLRSIPRGTPVNGSSRFMVRYAWTWRAGHIQHTSTITATIFTIWIFDDELVQHMRRHCGQYAFHSMLVHFRNLARNCSSWVSWRIIRNKDTSYSPRMHEDSLEKVA